MKISTKGQVTIPIDIRTTLGLLPDTEVTFLLQGNGVLITKQRNTKRRGTKLLSKLTGKNTMCMSTNQIMKLTRL